jgi:hypothetical protein
MYTTIIPNLSVLCFVYPGIKHQAILTIPCSFEAVIMSRSWRGIMWKTVIFRTEEVGEVSHPPTSTQYPLSTSTGFFLFFQQMYSINLSNKPQYNSKCSLLEIFPFYLYNDTQQLLKFDFFLTVPHSSFVSTMFCASFSTFFFSLNICYLSIALYRSSSLQSKFTKPFFSLLVGADPCCS